MRSAMLLALLLAELVVSPRALVTRTTSIDGSSLYFIDDLVDLPDDFVDDVHLGEDDEDPEQGPKGSSDQGAEDARFSTGAQGKMTDATEEEHPSGAPKRRSKENLSPQQRAEAHAAKYEAEFVVELNMTEAHATGNRLGIVLDRKTDYEAAEVHSVQKGWGLVEEWNKANPDKAVQVGDEIVRVNDIQWHANTKVFIQHIVGQFKAQRQQREGAAKTMRLYIRRPRVWKHKRFDYQRLDKHRKDYPVEFDAELPFNRNIEEALNKAGRSCSKAMELLMGWKVGATEEWKPAVISKIEPHGAVSDWNREHPDNLILEGDELMKVDTVPFVHNSSLFIANANRHYWAAMQATGPHGKKKSSWRSAKISIRRPRAIQMAFDKERAMTTTLPPPLDVSSDSTDNGKPADDAEDDNDDSDVIGAEEN